MKIRLFTFSFNFAGTSNLHYTCHWVQDVVVPHCMVEEGPHTLVLEHHTVLVAGIASAVAESDMLVMTAVLGIVPLVLGKNLVNDSCSFH